MDVFVLVVIGSLSAVTRTSNDSTVEFKTYFLEKLTLTALKAVMV